MAENTLIEWADHTFNPWIGCTKVSPGCDHCYAERREDLRLHRVQWGPGKPRQRTKTWRDPVKWNERAAAEGRRYRVFCASLADVFDNEVGQSWREDLFRLIEATPHLDWLLLTKRIGNAAEMMFLARGGHLPLLPNVWLGATVVNQDEVSRDVPKLLATPAAVRFLSIEPMLGPIDLVPFIHCDVGNAVDWVIAGGESGPEARPMHPTWVRSVRDQCAAAGVPFLFKQWGEWIPVEYNAGTDGVHEVEVLDGCGELPREGRYQVSGVGADAHPVVRVGKKAAGRLLDGIEHNGFPT